MNQIQQTPGEPHSRRRKPKKEKMIWKVLKVWMVCLAVALIVLTGLVIVRVAVPVATMYKQAIEFVEESDESTFKAEQTSIVYDANGNEIKKLKGEKDVHYLEYDDIPDAAKLAIISVEDKNFTSHRGIDMEGIARAVFSLIRNKGEITMGGSTITQQLARNIFLNFETTYSRKIQEMFIAVALEQKYTKEQILEFYLNNVYFSNGYYGIESAAEAYFNKDVNELSISQIAFLCAIPNSPSRFDPYDHPEATMERRDKILKNMYEEGYINKDQYDRSMAEEIKVLPKKETESNDYAETYIIKCATESLMKANGFEFKTTFRTNSEKEKYDEEYEEMYTNCKQSLYTGGYRIYTSIDMDMQRQLQESISSKLSMFTEKTDDGIYKVQGAAVTIDNETGRVVAIVGGREEDQEGYGLNRAYQSYRQPGSAIKPLLVYAPALEKGYTPYSTVDDSRMTGEDAVSNSGYSYSGSISLRRAVQKSSNVATYRLYQELGPEKCLQYLENMDFKGLDEKDYKYDTTCLGGFTNGTTVVEMAAGYATLANDGNYRTPTCIVKITDSDKNVIVPDAQKSRDIYSTNAARMMTDVLESCVTESHGTASGCKLDVDMPAACKTGTTSNYVDGWLCGYTPYYTTAVWVGMDVYQSVDNLKGNTYPAYIWKNFMDKAHQLLQRKEFDTYLGEEEEKETTKATTEEEKEEDLDVVDENDVENQEDGVEREDNPSGNNNNNNNNAPSQGGDNAGGIDTGNSGGTNTGEGNNTNNPSGGGSDGSQSSGNEIGGGENPSDTGENAGAETEGE